MTKHAAISAQLVDVRNYATEKCVRMTIHVPAEQAMAVLEIFGWPTAVDPIPVAIARLNDGMDTPSEAAGERVAPDNTPAASADRPLRMRKPEDKLKTQAVMCCNDPLFRVFLAETYSHAPDTAEDAADAIRDILGIASRSQIIPGTEVGGRWIDMHGKFLAWKLVDAIQ